MEINWFPGHMAKTLRKMKEQVKQVDLVIETCDARIPESSRNPELSKLIGAKPRILVLNKADLADPEATKAWIAYYGRLGLQVIAIDSTKRSGPEQVQDAAIALMQDKIDRSRERGRLFQPIRVMIAGIPNTGKSTLINTLVRRKAAEAQDRPGVTRSASWVRSSGQLELLDTPGVLWPKLGSRDSQIYLAATGAIRDVVLDLEEVSARTLHQLEARYPDLLAERYGVGRGVKPATQTGARATNATGEPNPGDFTNGMVSEADTGDDVDQPMLTTDPELAGGHRLLEAAARRRGFLQSGGRIDTARFASVFLDELRGGRIGRISLEWPPEQANRVRRGTEGTAPESEPGTDASPESPTISGDSTSLGDPAILGDSITFNEER